jgi:hypothetical protein
MGDVRNDLPNPTLSPHVFPVQIFTEDISAVSPLEKMAADW